MIVSIHQPCFFPYLGVFHKITRSDAFVILDDAQYSKGNVFERNRIKTPDGPQWVKAPIEYSFGDKLNRVRVKNDVPWQDRTIHAIMANYRQAPYLDECLGLVGRVINARLKTLADLGTASMLGVLELFGYKGKIYKASELGVGGKKEERVINLCKAVGADTYLSGVGGMAYQEPEHFAAHGLSLVYSDYEPRPYPQQHGGFATNLSVIDWLANMWGKNPFQE